MSSMYRPILPRAFKKIPQLAKLGAETLEQMEVVSQVLPFRVNEYVVSELIDWTKAPDDPIFNLLFPHQEMLSPQHFKEIRDLTQSGATTEQIRVAAQRVRSQLNPHPGDQVQLNVPNFDGTRIEGLQHKYRETVLFFPKSGQTCHAYCAFCFRWAQFVEDSSLRMALDDSSILTRYLSTHPEVSDLLITGGDPLTMSTRRLRAYLTPFFSPGLEHIQNIRIGTKALSFWPSRFVSDDDADDLLRLFEQLVSSGRHVAIMAHFNHHVELSTPILKRAVSRILSTGAQIRSQSPVLRHVNDDPNVWAAMWKQQVRLGIYPYYMFVVRDTGARTRFDLPLERCFHIYRDAIVRVSGLARTARGPSMSASPGKIEIQGITTVNDEKVFLLSFIQGRDPLWARRPFFARFDDTATWFNDLKPAFGVDHFFFETEATASSSAHLESNATRRIEQIVTSQAAEALDIRRTEDRPKHGSIELI